MDRSNHTLPSRAEMYSALERRDDAYEGIFVLGVRTTGIFCRPNCPARKPRPENVDYFPGAKAALDAGYRPCLRCRPLEPAGEAPQWLRPLLADLEAEPDRRWRDADLRARSLDPTRVRRWFQRYHGITFQAYQRARRLGRALGHLREGESIVTTALESGFESLSGFSEALQKLTGLPPDRSRDRHRLLTTRWTTPLGPVIAAADEEGLALLEFVDRRSIETQLRTVCKRLDAVLVPGTNDLLKETQRQLEAYFARERQDFDLPLHLRGTEFQETAWRALIAIPYGETRSYAEQARAIGRPTATRAVARANGDNRLGIVIPCHRVVGSDGRLTGYGGGLWRKQRLLEIEGARVAPP